MICKRLVACLMFLFLGTMAQTKTQKILSVRQDKHFMFAKAGDNLTLQCFYENVVDARFYWYKQNLGQKPRLVSTYYKYEANATFHDEFRNNPRFQLETAKGKNHLKIRNLRISDSAVYFCASSYLYRLDFAEGTMVYVEQTGSQLQTSVYQSGSETVRPGGSVTLNCTVQTGTCGGEHSVYWFKNSEHSEPGLIHSKGGENKLCDNKTSARTHSCVYKLPIGKLDASHAGTYYCAVASCGHILFGKGTKLDLIDTNNLETYLWAGAFSFTSLLSVSLAVSLCVIKKRSFKCSKAEKGSLNNPDVKDDYNAQKAHYAAFFALHNRPRRRKDPIWTECVYYRI
ncbi:immunoglobulin kappa light chain-like [Poeciliopsis prolifica]|uniref:immunoglobulin kappa light chain-like n=1 Tax=Poeciliopsis prolifica TaxID=188132 RepID=UPI00241434D7|nr:immunoglobulin kappa light chain-like [Poeciliopsis prolifica]